MDLTINGKSYSCLTTAELARHVGKKPVTLRHMEKIGQLPKANILIDNSGSTLKGKTRYYTRDLADELSHIFRNEKLNRKNGRSRDTIILIEKAFQNELKKLTEDA